MVTGLAFAQGTLADYQRAHSLQSTARGLVVNLPGPANWIAGIDHLWYWRSVKGGTEFILADAAPPRRRLPSSACVDCPGVAGRIFNAIGNHVPGSGRWLSGAVLNKITYAGGAKGFIRVADQLTAAGDSTTFRHFAIHNFVNFSCTPFCDSRLRKFAKST